MKNVELSCQGDHSQSMDGGSSFGYVPPSSPCVGFHGGHTITIDLSIPILALGANTETTHDQLSLALRTKRAYICPHLNFSSPELFSGRPMTAECPDYAFSEIKQRKYEIPCYNNRECSQLRLGKCVTWSQCPDPDCFTRYGLRRLWHAPYWCIVLQVSRDLLDGPTHRTWQAQMERKTAGDEINMPKRSKRIGSRPVMAYGAKFECGAHSKCKGECVLARYSSFMDS